MAVSNTFLPAPPIQIEFEAERQIEFETGRQIEFETSVRRDALLLESSIFATGAATIFFSIFAAAAAAAGAPVDVGRRRSPRGGGSGCIN